MAVVDLKRDLYPQLYPWRVRGSPMLSIPRRDTLTGTVYFFLIENRNGEDVVNIEPLREILNRKMGLAPGDGFTSMRQVHRKMDVLKHKHGMIIEKWGKEHYLYRVQPITKSKPAREYNDERLLELLGHCARRCASGEPIDFEIRDCLDLIKSEFRIGRK